MYDNKAQRICAMTPEEIWESIRLEKKIDYEVKIIKNDYNLITEEGKTLALRQAVWVGICLGKGWIE